MKQKCYFFFTTTNYHITLLAYGMLDDKKVLYKRDGSVFTDNINSKKCQRPTKSKRTSEMDYILLFFRKKQIGNMFK